MAMMTVVIVMVMIYQLCYQVILSFIVTRHNN